MGGFFSRLLVQGILLIQAAFLPDHRILSCPLVQIVFWALIPSPLLIPSMLISPAFAATDGTLGDSSGGGAEATLSVATLFRISGIQDMNFGSYTGSNIMQLDQDLCVWTNTAFGRYRVTARGSDAGAGYPFRVVHQNNASRSIPYTVRWNTTSGTAGNSPLVANVASADKSGANTESTTCATGPSATANVAVTFSEADLLAARSGTYTGTLTIIVSGPSQ